MKYLLMLLITTASFAATIDEQIAANRARIDSLTLATETLASSVVAAHLDSLAQADSTLKADKVRVVAHRGDAMYVDMVIGHLIPLDVRLVRAALTEGGIKYVLAGDDTLALRKDRAELALPVISAALR